MPQPDFQTVFEIGFRTFPWGGLTHPLPFAFVGALLFRFGKTRRVYQVTGIAVAAFASFFFLIAAAAIVPEFIQLRRTYKAGNSAVVQGVVEQFRPAPMLGPARESFTVGGAAFSYNVLDISPCFHNAPAHKGPITPGLEVRIYFKDQCIQRVDIRREHP